MTGIRKILFGFMAVPIILIYLVIMAFLIFVLRVDRQGDNPPGRNKAGVM